MPRPFDRILAEMATRGDELDEKVQEVTRVLRDVQTKLQAMPGKVFVQVSGSYDVSGGRATDSLSFVLCNGAWLLIYKQGSYEQVALDAQIFAKARSLALLPSLLEELRTKQYNANTEVSQVLMKFGKLSL